MVFPSPSGSVFTVFQHFALTEQRRIICKTILISATEYSVVVLADLLTVTIGPCEKTPCCTSEHWHMLGLYYMPQS